MKTRSSSHQSPIQLDDDDVRISKKQIKDEGDELIPQSTLEVVFNDDLLIEILVRLPLLSLCAFKSVSKRWLSLITHLNITRPSGFFIQRRRTVLWPRRKSFYGHDFIPFDVSIPENITTFPFGSPGSILIWQSCNGLLLCQQMETQTYYIYNPTTKQFKKLPRCYYSKLVKSYGYMAMRMAFDPTKSPHYTVFCMFFRKVSDTSIQLKTYSSKTRKWRVCGDKFSYDDFRNFNSAIYWNGAIHWMASGHYNKLDVQHDPLLTKLPIPFGPIHKLYVSWGTLLFISLGSYELGIYEMNGYSNKWSKKYVVSLEDVIRNERPQTRTLPRLERSFLGIVEGEREEDVFIVLNLHKHIVQYNIMLKTVRKLFDRRRSPLCSYEDTFPFVASFSGV